MAMKRMSIQDLKISLSAAVAEASSGKTIVITRHNRPVAQLTPPYPPHVHRGGSVGSDRVRSALRRGSKGRYLSLLLEDRGIVER